MRTAQFGPPCGFGLTMHSTNKSPTAHIPRVASSGAAGAPAGEIEITPAVERAEAELLGEFTERMRLAYSREGLYNFSDYDLLLLRARSKRR
jgi:hypothetical protein